MAIERDTSVPEASPPSIPPSSVGWIVANLTRRAADTHKGDYGRALLIGGSRGMAGAIALAGKATLRSGAGLVTLAVSDANLDTVAAFEPSYMTAPLASDEAGRIALAARERLETLLAAATAVAIGPGLGRSADLDQLVAWLYKTCRQSAVFDADALNALAARDSGLPLAVGPRILTPHPGEFARLIGHKLDDRAAQRAAAEAFAAEHRVVLVLKGSGTIVTDGENTYINPTGNPGMATGGSGDVLTGVITGLVAQGLLPFDAARAGVYLHGLAGDLAAERLGQVSLIAGDLVEWLPAAILRASDERGLISDEC